MPDKFKMKSPDGGEMEAVPVNINQANEQWNTYLLEDGSVLKVKLVVTKIARVSNQYDVEGNPVYFFHSTNVTSVEAPGNLKGKQ